MRRLSPLRLMMIAGIAAQAPGYSGIVFTQIPIDRAGAAKSEGGRLVLLEPSGATRVLTAGFESAADPAVSFDGTRILFAGKRRSSEPWNIYEMKADGSAVRRITHDLGNCRSPIYQSPIFYLDDPGPMPQIAFVSDEPAGFGEHGPARSTHLYSARLDGSGVRRLTYNPSGAFDPAMLPDGRMLFSSWRAPSLAEPSGYLDLFGVNIDGTDFAAFSGVQGRRVKHMACVTAKRQVVFVDADSVSWDGAGPLAVIDLRRNLHSYRRLTLASQGLFHSPSPLPDGSLLVARRTADGRGTHGIYRLDPATRVIELVFDAAGSHEIQPQALAPREIPDGRSSVVDEKQPWAKLYCLNLYDSDLDSRLWPKGIVKRIRVLEGLARSASAAGSFQPLRKRFIGEIDVDEDGSFNLQIPANTPVRIQALDANGMSLRTCAWIWAKNKEQRGCIGCHEDGERTPENVMASALTRASINLMLAPDRRRTVEFDRDVAPILERKCATAACHGGTVLPKLSGQGAQVTPGSARTSPLIWAVFGKNTSRPWDRAAGAATPKPMPHPGAAPLTDSEKRAIIEWIDLGGGQ